MLSSMKNLFMYILLLFASSSCGFELNTREKSGAHSTTPIPSETLDSLKMIITNLSNHDTIPSDYLSYFGFRDWYRWPLVFPYSLNSIDSRDNGFLCYEKEAKSISGSNDGIEQIYLGDIKRFTFNEQLLICETGDKGSKRYKSFRFSDQTIRKYADLDSLYAESQDYGTMIMDSLITLKQYSLIFSH
jgi:hypothetical protein